MPSLIRLIIFLLFLAGHRLSARCSRWWRSSSRGRRKSPCGYRRATCSASPIATRLAREDAETTVPAEETPADGPAAGEAAEATGGPAGMRSGSGAHLIDAFLEMMSAERGAAANTIEAYRRDLSDYFGFLLARASDPLSAPRRTFRPISPISRPRGSPPRPVRGGSRRCGNSTGSCAPTRSAATIRRGSSPAPNPRRGCRRCCRSPRSTCC